MVKQKHGNGRHIKGKKKKKGGGDRGREKGGMVNGGLVLESGKSGGHPSVNKVKK